MSREHRGELRKTLGIELFEHARDAPPPHCSILWRNVLRDHLEHQIVREGVLQQAAAAGLTDDAAIEKFVERVAERGVIPGADFAHRIARETIADAGRDFGNGTRRLREPLDAARHDLLQRSGFGGGLSLTSVGHYLRQEERVAVRSCDQRLCRTARRFGERDAQLLNIGFGEAAQPKALRTDRNARLSPQAVQRRQLCTLFVAISEHDHHRQAGNSPQ